MKEQTQVEPHLMQALERYRDEHRDPGGFLRAILENDLLMAVRFAGMEERKDLDGIVWQLFHTFPASVWGSASKVEAWLRSRETVTRPWRTRAELVRAGNAPNEG